MLQFIKTIFSKKQKVIPPVADTAFRVLSSDEQQCIKDKYSNSYNYFIFYGDMSRDNNITGLLKAFSIFKKWQQSNMKLLLVGDLPGKRQDEAISKLSSYKYKDDVVYIPMPEIEELAKIVGASYSLILLTLSDEGVLPILNAMACGVPVITSNLSGIREMAQKRALYADSGDIQAIADQMSLLYKDEALHERMSKLGN